METEGTIHVLRLDRPTDPQPWTYDVTFAPSARERRCQQAGPGHFLSAHRERLPCLHGVTLFLNSYG